MAACIARANRPRLSSDSVRSAPEAERLAATEHQLKFVEQELREKAAADARAAEETRGAGEALKRERAGEQCETGGIEPSRPRHQPSGGARGQDQAQQCGQ